MTELLIKLAIGAAIVAAVTGAGYGVYSHIKDIGYAEAEAKYKLVIKEYEDNQNKKIDNIEATAKAIADSINQSNASLSSDMASILKGMKGKTLTIVKNGNCTPSSEFSDSINTINKRVNQSIKDSQK